MEDLRQACAEVARRARSVTIDTDAIDGYAQRLPSRPARAGGADPTPGSSREDRAAYWLTLDAINFGSGWFPTLRKPEGGTGYGTISARLNARFASHGPWPATELASLTAGEVAGVLGQDPGHQLMALFASSLNDLGRHVAGEHGERFAAGIDAAGGSAVALARRLGSWSCFSDASGYDELTVPFLKRAQITAADLARAHIARFDDLDRLTMFADNLVPHVLRLDGVLSFDPRLLARIERGELIEHDSREEIEIRACALHSVELIVAAQRAAGRRTMAAEVDQVLWQRGQEPLYKASPRHRSRCTAY